MINADSTTSSNLVTNSRLDLSNYKVPMVCDNLSGRIKYFVSAWINETGQLTKINLSTKDRDCPELKTDIHNYLSDLKNPIWQGEKPTSVGWVKFNFNLDYF